MDSAGTRWRIASLSRWKPVVSRYTCPSSGCRAQVHCWQCPSRWSPGNISAVRSQVCPESVEVQISVEATLPKPWLTIAHRYMVSSMVNHGFEIGRAHVGTPVTWRSRKPAAAGTKQHVPDLQYEHDRPNDRWRDGP